MHFDLGPPLKQGKVWHHPGNVHVHVRHAHDLNSTRLPSVLAGLFIYPEEADEANLDTVIGPVSQEHGNKLDTDDSLQITVPWFSFQHPSLHMGQDLGKDNAN